MSAWGKIKKRIKKAAKAAAKAGETVVNAVEEVVVDVVETAGNGIEDGFAAVADVADKIPVIGGPIGGVLRWTGGVISAAFDVVGAVVKGALGIVSAVLSGVILMLGGILSLDGRLFLDGFLHILSGVAGAVILIIGKLITLIQTILLLQARERRLTRAERELLKRVYRRSIALYNVRIVDGFAGIYSLDDSSFTLGNTIYLKDFDSTTYPQNLVHEGAHVWQYQNLGAWYVSDALGAQLFIQNAYSWEDEIARGKEHWEDYNREAQAEIFETIYTDGELITGPNVSQGNGVFYDADGKMSLGRLTYNGTNYTHKANEAVASVRSEIAIRISGWFS